MLHIEQDSERFWCEIEWVTLLPQRAFSRTHKIYDKGNRGLEIVGAQCIITCLTCGSDGSCTPAPSND